MDDCQESGNKYASAKMNLLITENERLSTKLVKLSHVGFCDQKHVPSSFKVHKYEMNMNIGMDGD